MSQIVLGKFVKMYIFYFSKNWWNCFQNISATKNLSCCFVFKTIERVSSITSYKDSFCQFFMSRVIKQLKCCILKTLKNPPTSGSQCAPYIFFNFFISFLLLMQLYVSGTYFSSSKGSILFTLVTYIYLFFRSKVLNHSVALKPTIYI